MKKFVAVMMIMVVLIGGIRVERAQALTGIEEAAVLSAIGYLAGEVGVEFYNTQARGAGLHHWYDNLAATTQQTLLDAYNSRRLTINGAFLEDFISARDQTLEDFANEIPIDYSSFSEYMALTVPGWTNTTLFQGEIDVNMTLQCNSSSGSSVDIYTNNPNNLNEGTPKFHVYMESTMAYGRQVKWSYQHRVQDNPVAGGTIFYIEGPGQSGGSYGVHVGLSVINGAVNAMIDGSTVYSDTSLSNLVINDITTSRGSVALTNVAGSYASKANTVYVLQEGTDYDVLQSLLENQILLNSLIGQTLELDENGGVVGVPTVVPPGTVTPTFDDTGIISWLSTIWKDMAAGVNTLVGKMNTVISGVNGVTSAVNVAVGAINTVVTGVNGVIDAVNTKFADLKLGLIEILTSIYNDVHSLLEKCTAYFADPEPGWTDPIIAPFQDAWDAHVPDLPELGMDQFEEPTFDWTVTIHHPWEASFELMNTAIVEQYRPTIKLWAGGIMVFITVLMIYRRIPQILGV